MNKTDWVPPSCQLTSLGRDQRSLINYRLISGLINAREVKYRGQEEYYKEEPNLVRGFLLKGEQELLRQSELFLEKGQQM